MWRHYDEAFADLPIELPAPSESDTHHSYHLYTVLINEKWAGVNRDAFLDGITAKNISVGVH
ncbi:DegT/DnrJ/EryC1/StrS family aminotransferase [Acaryochloris sp. CCMEE 5410]|uniref:DegT/DnrJ/EryC1/StrS family aminotransferase n=1 Tax=Acaryochloris sp. CCMEE 5410 TaxID=310037 RepID=UPI001111A319|nr:DegT/DnrJ/EryC1/StrS family aminotransferase [Acaryochloris sp. CCMEE 5410]